MTNTATFTVAHKQTLVAKLQALIEKHSLSNQVAARIIFGNDLPSHWGQLVSNWVNGTSFPTGARVLELNDFFLKGEAEIDMIVEKFKEENKPMARRQSSPIEDDNVKQLVITLANILAKVDTVLANQNTIMGLLNKKDDIISLSEVA